MKCLLLMTGMLCAIASSDSAALKDTKTILSPIEAADVKKNYKRELPVPESLHGWDSRPSSYVEPGWGRNLADWKPEPAGWHSEPKTVIVEKKVPYPVKVPVHVPHTVTVEKPVHIYKPYIVEKKVHVPHEVVVEKPVPVFVERHRPQVPISVIPIADSTLLGQSLVANRVPLLDSLVSGGIFNNGILNGGAILGSQGTVLTGNNILGGGILSGGTFLGNQGTVLAGNSILGGGSTLLGNQGTVLTGGSILGDGGLNSGILGGGILSGGILNGGILGGGILNSGTLGSSILNGGTFGGILGGGILGNGLLGGGTIFGNQGTVLNGGGIII